MSLPVAVQLLLCPLVLIALLRTTAPYGRHFAAGWGPCLPGRTAWFLMELPGLLVIAAVIQLSAVELPPILWLPWLMWSLHYGYRTFVFPAMMRTSGLAFALFTACNLVPRALANHRWYQRRFPEYPPERKIILPFVY
jgi:hypothetical protein